MPIESPHQPGGGNVKSPNKTSWAQERPHSFTPERPHSFTPGRTTGITGRVHRTGRGSAPRSRCPRVDRAEVRLAIDAPARRAAWRAHSREPHSGQRNETVPEHLNVRPSGRG